MEKRMFPPLVTVPISTQFRSHLSKMACTSASRPFFTTTSIRSWLSLRRISHARMPDGAWAPYPGTIHTCASLRTHLTGAARDPRGTHVLHADDGIGLRQFQ
jgi:hypothetical protein